MSSFIQSILFDRSKFTTIECRRWLKSHHFIPIKRVDRTDQYYHYRLQIPQHFNRFSTKRTKNYISFVIGYI